MAGTTAPRRKRARAKPLPGMEDARVKEIEDAALDYRDARDERMGLTDKEKEAKEKLIEVMEKHQLSIYKGDGWSVTYNSKETKDVKLQTAPEVDVEENDDE
jgi:hypothetical protein